MTPLENLKTEEFIRLVTLYQPRVYLFILSLVPNRADADEVMQETNLVLWRRFDEFRPGSDFRAWAFQIAYFKVQQFLEKQNRSKIRFGEEYLEKVSAFAIKQPDVYDQREEALADCMNRLSEKDRGLIEARYQEGQSVTSLSSSLGRSAEAIYKAVQRIRRVLYDCIHRKLLPEER